MDDPLDDPVDDAVVIGGSVAGLCTALALAQEGRRVTVVERDDIGPQDSPHAAFAAWQRRGAPQARHSHAFLARLRNLLRDRAPDVLAELLDAGASELRFAEHLPPTLAPLVAEPGDEDLVALACRRTTFEWVLRRHVAGLAGASLIQGTVEGLVVDAATTGGPARPPHVTGVRLVGGAVHRAGLVVDASGRRSALPAWLGAVGAAPVEEVEHDTGIVYSSRFYRLLPGSTAPPLQRLVVGDLGYLKYAVFAGDNGTFSITFGLRSGDAEMRRLLHPAAFTATAEALEPARALVAPDSAEPISGVEVMTGLINRMRHFAPGGRPVATGVFAVGDASVCTNPLYGRGCSLAAVQAFLLADVLAAQVGTPEEAGLAYEAATAEHIEPWYKAALAQDQADHDEVASESDGSGSPGMAAIMRDGLLPAARTDPVVYRAFIRSFNLLDPPGTMMRDAEVVTRVLATWSRRSDQAPEARSIGPDRAELLALLDEATPRPVLDGD